MISPFASRRLSDPERGALLNDLLVQAEALSAKREQAVMVFDLDGTLMDNRPRVVAILHEMADAWSAEHPAAAAQLRNARTETMRYGLVENLQALGVDAALHEAGLKFWLDRFFIDPYMKHDTRVPGAREYVQRCYDAGINIVYLTGRDLPNMALGSLASLRDLGFPIGIVGTELVTKPDFETPDEVFKKSVAAALSRLGRVLAVFDNEPGNCNLLLHAHPECTSVFLDTLHAANPPTLDERAHVVDSFVV